VTVSIGTGAVIFTGSQDMTIDVESRGAAQFDLDIPDTWSGAIPYTVTLFQ
jgi:hypothetical protein